MSPEYLQFHAAERPGDLAFTDGTREVGFAAMLRDFGLVVEALRGLGLPPGRSVAVGHDDFYTHWLLQLGCEHLGIAVASFQPSEGANCRPLLGSVDLVLAEAHYPRGGWRAQILAADWLATLRAGPGRDPGPAAIWRPEQVRRIVRTSGTTGVQKRLNLSCSVWQARLAQKIWLYRDLPAGAGLLVTLPVSLGIMQHYAALALASGLTLVAAGRAGIAAIPEMIRRYRVGAMLLLPIQLKQLLDALPPDWVKPADLELSTSGAPLPPGLREAALARLARRVANLYASNETGLVSIERSVFGEGAGEGAGLIAPGTEIRIADEQGRTLADGEPGRILVRGAGVFHGYADDPSLTRRVLRDGWFLCGDFGVRTGGRLRVLGRVDDQANLGGVKLALARVEEAVQRSAGAGLKDAGAVVLPNAAGLDALCVALATDGTDDRTLLDRVIPVLRSFVPGDIELVRLPSMPRNETGKIDRARLKAEIQAILAAGRTLEDATP